MSVTDSTLLDLEEPETHREPEPTGPGAAGVEPEDPALTLGQGAVGVTEDDYVDAVQGSGAPHRGPVVEEQDPGPAQLQAAPFREGGRPPFDVHVPPHRDHRCQLAQLLEDVGATDVPGVDDDVDATKSFQGLRAYEAMGV